ncbi:hypothetical protein [Actinoplanes sp. NPDC049599]
MNDDSTPAQSLSFTNPAGMKDHEPLSWRRDVTRPVLGGQNC